MRKEFEETSLRKGVYPEAKKCRVDEQCFNIVIYSKQHLKSLEEKEVRMKFQRKTLSLEGKKQDGSNCGSETGMKMGKETWHVGMSLKFR